MLCREVRGERWLRRMETGGSAWEPSPVHGPTFPGGDSGSGGAWRKEVWAGRDQVSPGGPSLIAEEVCGGVRRREEVCGGVRRRAEA